MPLNVDTIGDKPKKPVPPPADSGKSEAEGFARDQTDSLKMYQWQKEGTQLLSIRQNGHKGRTQPPSKQHI